MRARPLEWDVPGGKVDSNESPTDAVIREVQEETGLYVTDPELVTSEGGEWKGGRHDFFYYKVIVGQTYTPTLSTEHCEWRWVDISTAGSMLTFRAHSYGLRALLKQINT